MVNLALTDFGITGIVNPFNVVGKYRSKSLKNFMSKNVNCQMISRFNKNNNARNADRQEVGKV